MAASATKTTTLLAPPVAVPAPWVTITLGTDGVGVVPVVVCVPLPAVLLNLLVLDLETALPLVLLAVLELEPASVPEFGRDRLPVVWRLAVKWSTAWEKEEGSTYAAASVVWKRKTAKSVVVLMKVVFCKIE
jgi:hypothetical protein